MEAAGWVDRGVLSVFQGPREYLYGEETALLEAVAGRPPFPRIAPPWRRGATDVVVDVEDAASESGLAAPVLMAGATEAPPALINNVETIANVPAIIANGPDWFRSLGTEQSPGTIVCTVSGSTQRAGVAEIPMGTPVRVAIETIGGGVEVGRRVAAVLMGVANAVLTGDQLDTPLTYEAMRDAGSGLGSAGMIVLADDVDLLAAAAGVARFLAIESCGQCTPCKQDGLALASRLTEMGAGNVDPDDAATVADLLATVADGARCALAASTAERRRQPRRPRRAAAPTASRGRRGRATRPAARRRARRHRRRPGRRRRRVPEQAARLDLRRDRLRPIPGRPPHRQARRLTPIPIWAASATLVAVRTPTSSQRPQNQGGGASRSSSAWAAAAAVIVPSRTAVSISPVRRRTAGMARKRLSR